MKIDIVCPLYKPNDIFINLLNDIKQQKNVIVDKIVCPVTVGSLDEDTSNIQKNKDVIFFKVLKKDFSHSLTREKAIREYCSSDIVVLLSQDVKLLTEDTLYRLCESIKNGETVFNYARQICLNKSIESYAREKNYPANSFVVDNSNLSFSSFFASDACSAIDRKTFIELNGYQGINLMMNEDQLYSYIVLTNGYKKGYIANAVVEHSHKYTLKQLYYRYYETGKSYKQIPFVYKYGVNDSGFSLAKYVLKRAFKDFNIKAIFMWPFDMASRYFGLKKGMRGN